MSHGCVATRPHQGLAELVSVSTGRRCACACVLADDKKKNDYDDSIVFNMNCLDVVRRHQCTNLTCSGRPNANNLPTRRARSPSHNTNIITALYTRSVHAYTPQARVYTPRNTHKYNYCYNYRLVRRLPYSSVKCIGTSCVLTTPFE